MIYAKTTANGIPQEIPLTELPLFCKCPECGAEVKTSVYEMLEAKEVFNDFDPDACGIYCDHCQEELNTIREKLMTACTGAEDGRIIYTLSLSDLKQLLDFYFRHKK